MINIPVNRPVFRPIHQLITEYYGTGYVPSIMLDFTSGFLDPRINFSRTTNATVTNSAGVITYAPHNLLTFSEQFDNATWTKVNATITANSIIAPDETTTADTLTISSTSGYPYKGITVVAGTSYTMSVYAKAGDTNGITLAVFTQIGQIKFSLDGTNDITIVQGTSLSNGVITSVGDGWYRCSAVFSPTIS